MVFRERVVRSTRHGRGLSQVGTRLYMYVGTPWKQSVWAQKDIYPLNASVGTTANFDRVWSARTYTQHSRGLRLLCLEVNTLLAGDARTRGDRVGAPMVNITTVSVVWFKRVLSAVVRAIFQAFHTVFGKRSISK